MTPEQIDAYHRNRKLRELEAYFSIRFRGQKPDKANYFEAFDDYCRLLDNIENDTGIRAIVWQENIGKYRKARNEKAETKRIKCLLIDAILSIRATPNHLDAGQVIIDNIEQQLKELN